MSLCAGRRLSNTEEGTCMSPGLGFDLQLLVCIFLDNQKTQRFEASCKARKLKRRSKDEHNHSCMLPFYRKAGDVCEKRSCCLTFSLACAAPSLWVGAEGSLCPAQTQHHEQRAAPQRGPPSGLPAPVPTCPFSLDFIVPPSMLS